MFCPQVNYKINLSLGQFVTSTPLIKCKCKSLSRVCSLWPHGLYSPWNSPGQNTAVGSLSLLQGIFSTQGSNPGLLHCRWILYQLSHKGSPRILEWVAYPFSSRSSRPSNRTNVSYLVGGSFTNWPIREAQHHYKYSATLKFVIVQKVQKGMFGAKSIYLLHLQLFKLSYNVFLIH